MAVLGQDMSCGVAGYQEHTGHSVGAKGHGLKGRSGMNSCGMVGPSGTSGYLSHHSIARLMEEIASQERPLSGQCSDLRVRQLCRESQRFKSEIEIVGTRASTDFASFSPTLRRQQYLVTLLPRQQTLPGDPASGLASSGYCLDICPTNLRVQLPAYICLTIQLCIIFLVGITRQICALTALQVRGPFCTTLLKRMCSAYAPPHAGSLWGKK
jgi:hypothetical protein